MIKASDVYVAHRDKYYPKLFSISCINPNILNNMKYFILNKIQTFDNNS